MKNLGWTILAVFFIFGYAGSQTYFVDNQIGRDNWPGTINQPWQRLDTAINRLHPGDTLFVRQGDYTSAGFPINFVIHFIFNHPANGSCFQAIFFYFRLGIN